MNSYTLPNPGPLVFENPRTLQIKAPPASIAPVGHPTAAINSNARAETVTLLNIYSEQAIYFRSTQ